LRECLHNLSGGMDVLTLLEAQVVGAADACEGRDLFAAKTRHTAAHTSNQPDVFGTELFAPRTQVVAQRVGPHCHPPILSLTLPISR
jgi:hypothetical protein